MIRSGASVDAAEFLVSGDTYDDETRQCILDNDDELAWLKKMKTRGSLNERGKENLKLALALKKDRESDS